MAGRTFYGLLATFFWRLIQSVRHGSISAGSKLGNAAPPPRNHFSGPLKIFFLDGDTKERGLKGQCIPENFAEFDLILEDFCAFLAFKTPQF